MIHPGVCSLTLPQLNPQEIIDLCIETGLTHIEWWGKDHAPMGDISVATIVGELTRKSGLIISTYGSYYKVGDSEEKGLSFQDVLNSAVALKAPSIRVWAGAGGSKDCHEDQRNAVIDDTFRIAEMSEKEGISITFEYHGGTLTDSNSSTIEFLGKVEHPSIFSGWQPRTGVELSENLEGLQEVLTRLSTIHVFNWTKSPEGKHLRHPLNESIQEWQQYFDIVSKSGRDHNALLEFVKDGKIDQFKKDAKTLVELVRI
jgi:sugar phosphate isomerase/epimerase